MKKRIRNYKIQLIGCDDSTSINIDLDINEFRLVDRIARLLTDASSHSCEPTMAVYEIPRDTHQLG
jgi:hypothetical protein